MSAEEPLIADLFEVDKRLSLKPVVDFNAYLRNAFGDGPCRCHRCGETGGDESGYSHRHTFELDGRPLHRRFANTAASDVLLALKKAWLSYTKRELPLAGELAPGLHCLTGLGGRGLTLAPLLAEHVAATITGAPNPLPRDLQAAVDPRR